MTASAPSGPTGAVKAPGRGVFYESRNGKVPKDLVTMFAGMPTPQIARSPRPFLTDRERGTLSEVLGFIDRHGARILLSVADVAGEASPAIRTLTAARGPLFELKIQSAQHNPRFLFVLCNDAVVFLAAFAKKTQKLRRVDVARAADRFQTMKDECE